MVSGMGDAAQIEEDPISLSQLAGADERVLIRIPVCEFLRDCGFKVIEATPAMRRSPLSKP